MKINKKLIYSIATLIISFVSCVFVTFAWFAKGKAEAKGGIIQIGSMDDGIDGLTITAYYLNETNEGEYVLASNGNLTSSGQSISPGTLYDHGSDGKLTSEKDLMRPYGSLSGATTAVLFKLDYKVKAGTNRHYRVIASCPDSQDITVTKQSGNAFTSHLSNAVGFNANVAYSAVGGNAVYKAKGEADKQFVVSENGSYSKITKLNLCTVTAPANHDGDYEGQVYVIMDYNSKEFGYVYSLVLSGGGNLTSSLTFSGGISIGMEAYDPSI
jgi:hypothetical protein